MLLFWYKGYKICCDHLSLLCYPTIFHGSFYSLIISYQLISMFFTTCVCYFIFQGRGTLSVNKHNM